MTLTLEVREQLARVRLAVLGPKVDDEPARVAWRRRQLEEEIATIVAERAQQLPAAPTGRLPYRDED